MVTFGNPARDAWNAFKATPSGAALAVFHQHALHPTASDSSGGAITVKEQLTNWNAALKALHAKITTPDVVKPLVLYGQDFTPAELPEIPSQDLAMGVPAWMRRAEFWATMSAPPGSERANISITVP